MERENMSKTITSQLPLTQGINLMLGGAMLSGIILIVCFMCYCCHKRAQKHQQTQLHVGTTRRTVYAIEGVDEAYDCEEVVLSDIHMSSTETPPPSYEAIVPMNKDIYGPSNRARHNEESGLPSYEAALQLAAAGHV